MLVAERDRFLSANDGLRSFVIDEVREILGGKNIEDVCDWVQSMHMAVTTGGKLARGLAVVETSEILLNRKMTDEEYLQVAAVGWCIEWLQASFLIADDIMDHSMTRRGRPCWYIDAGMMAINDAFLLQSLIFRLLKKIFIPEKYHKVSDLFMDVRFRTELGQLMDLLTAPTNKPTEFASFTNERYTMIVRYKTAYYSFYLPVKAAFIIVSFYIQNIRVYSRYIFK